MSRRHKEIPTITRQELWQVAEETSKQTIDRIVKKSSKLKRLDFETDRLSECYSDKIDLSKLNLICGGSGHKSAMSKIKSTLAGVMSLHNPIFEDPEQNFHPHTLNDVHEMLTSTLFDNLCSTVAKRIGGLTITDAWPCDKATGRSKNKRPMVMQLYDRFKDTDLIDMMKEIYMMNKKFAIEKANDLIDQLVAYLLTIYKIKGCRKGLTAGFHRLTRASFTDSLIPCLKTFQNKVSEYWRLFDAKVKGCLLRSEKEELGRWNRLIDMYYNGIERLAPQYALY